MTSPRANIATVALALVLSVVLFGCGDKKAPSKPAAAKATSKVKQEKTVAPTSTDEKKVEQEVFIYEARGRRDPFASLVVKRAPTGERTTKLNPLEKFGVDQIRLTAIVRDGADYYASITLPDGKYFTIRRGTVLGLFEGKVEKITKDTVLIREFIKDYRGKLQQKDTLLRLRKEGEE